MLLLFFPSFSYARTLQVELALFVEMVCMMKNDLECMLPDENGVRVCNLAVRELCHAAVKLVDMVEQQG